MLPSQTIYLFVIGDGPTFRVPKAFPRFGQRWSQEIPFQEVAMELEIRGLGLEPTPVFRRDIERRLRHGLRRFDAHLERVTVRLSREPGRGRHSSRRCQVTVDVRGLPPLRVAESCRTIESAFARAASRTKRDLARGLLVRRSNLRMTRRALRGAARSAEVPLDLAAARSEAAAFGQAR